MEASLNGKTELVALEVGPEIDPKRQRANALQAEFPGDDPRPIAVAGHTLHRDHSRQARLHGR